MSEDLEKGTEHDMKDSCRVDFYSSSSTNRPLFCLRLWTWSTPFCQREEMDLGESGSNGRKNQQNSKFVGQFVYPSYTLFQEGRCFINADKMGCKAVQKSNLHENQVAMDDCL